MQSRGEHVLARAAVLLGLSDRNSRRTAVTSGLSATVVRGMCSTLATSEKVELDAHAGARAMDAAIRVRLRLSTVPFVWERAGLREGEG